MFGGHSTTPIYGTSKMGAKMPALNTKPQAKTAKAGEKKIMPAMIANKAKRGC